MRTRGLLFVTALLVLSSALAQVLPQKSEWVTSRHSGVTIHTYVSPDGESMRVTSHILETRGALVVVDAQFLLPEARKVRAYADALGKPINRVILTHSHADHWLGSEAFADRPIFAPTFTRDFLRANGANVARMVDASTTGETSVNVPVPRNTITPTENTIDGLKLRYRLVNNLEDDQNLVILLPEAGVVIAQDLVYNGMHAVTAENHLPNWIKTLQEFKVLPGYDTVLAGHGRPGGPELYDGAINYLRVAQRTITSDPTRRTYVQTMRSAFPTYGGERLLNISVQFAQ